MEILRLEGVSFSYPEAASPALAQVDLTVDAGEFVVLCGASGCGKSTLLRLLKPALSPYGKQEGAIRYGGVPIAQVDERTAASEIGFILQDPESQIVTDTVWHELAFGPESLGLDNADIRRRVAEMASYFGIESWFHRKTAELSGGQKQLLNLGAVMACGPKVLLLDEPTAQLDPIAASTFIGMLHRLNRELGLTVILIEHRLEEVFPLADRVLLLEDGRVALYDRPQTVAAQVCGDRAHPLWGALPSAMRVFALLENSGDSPLTVREGRAYLTATYDNRIPALPEEPYTHSDEAAVELREVFFRFERRAADVLRGLSLTVYRGEHFCLLGGNGTGKTTTLGVIAGLNRAYRGTVRLFGKAIGAYTNNELYRRGVALLPQNPQTVFLEKTVRADLQETCAAMAYDAAESERRIGELAEELGLVHLLDTHPYDLSGGEQQKAALAKVLLLQPRVLLLDEPTKGIDAAAKQALGDILRRLQVQGMTVVTVTHDVEFAAAVADRVGMVFDGEITAVDTPCRFFADNSFYTTAAARMSRGHYRGAVRCEQVAALCRQNGKKAVSADA